MSIKHNKLKKLASKKPKKLYAKLSVGDIFNIADTDYDLEPYECLYMILSIDKDQYYDVRNLTNNKLEESYFAVGSYTESVCVRL